MQSVAGAAPRCSLRTFTPWHASSHLIAATTTKRSPKPLCSSGGASPFSTSILFISGPSAADTRCSCEPISQKRARPSSPSRPDGDGVTFDRAPSVSPPPRETRNTCRESPSPPPSQAHVLQLAQALFKHISTTAFLERQSVMQKLATAEQCHDHAAQLLAQAKQSHDKTSQSRLIQHISESCTQLQLKMDSFPGHGTRVYVFDVFLTHLPSSSRRASALFSQAFVARV